MEYMLQKLKIQQKFYRIQVIFLEFYREVHQAKAHRNCIFSSCSGDEQEVDVILLTCRFVTSRRAFIENAGPEPILENISY